MPDKTENLEKYGKVVRIPGELSSDLKNMQKKFGYIRTSDSAINAVKAGLKIFKNDPSEFLKLISDN